MKTIHLVASVLLVATSAAAGFHSQPATVGPPLVCFQYDIGTAKSLPWGNNADDAFDFDTQYDVKNLIPDTLAILRGSDDALVHMETLRRAAIYAARSEGKLAKSREASLECRLVAIVLDASLKRIASDPKSPLPWIDAGYAVGASAHMGGSLGYSVSWIEHFNNAVALAPEDGAVSFAVSAA